MIFKVFVRSFFIQSSWNYGEIQGLGFSTAIAPAIAAIYQDEGARAEARMRHREDFNIHPYMSAPVLGAVIKMEEEVMAGKRDREDIILFKKSLSSPYSAIGDMFFWGSVRPFASIVGVGTALYFGLPALLLFLMVYNLFHLWMRWFGLTIGYRLGVDVVEYIKELELLKWGRRIRYITVIILACIMASFVLRTAPLEPHGRLHGSFPLSTYLMIVTFTLAALLLASLLRRGISITALVFMVAIPMTFVVLLGSLWLF
ncbi:MAG: PTS system mannose/fructose/sorbose family transporter subunit IID [Deltaproteobacteria bacterium]|nr:PTS system mannose/fructose/sorbose family transporter subunit IID [Deltaproteobacteria bacterium]